MITFDFGFTNKTIHINPIIVYIIIIFGLIYLMKIFKADTFNRCILYFKVNFRTIWFFLISSILSLYCISNWSEVTKITPLTANPFILAFLGILLLLPFIKNFDILGVKGEMADMFRMQSSQDNLNRVENQFQTQNVNQHVSEKQIEEQNQLRQELNEQQSERGV